jgi:hypothetical protein
VNLLSNVGEVSRSFMLSTLENAPRAVTNNGCAYSKAARGAPRRKIPSIVAPVLTVRWYHSRSGPFSNYSFSPRSRPLVTLGSDVWRAFAKETYKQERDSPLAPNEYVPEPCASMPCIFILSYGIL